MSVLYWEKPAKIMSRKEWESISADGAPPGVYSPNMSREDMFKWKAKAFPKSGRVEIRKTTRNSCTQVLIKVFTHEVIMSMNGSASFTDLEWLELPVAVKEARLVLWAAPAPKPRKGGFENADTSVGGIPEGYNDYFN